LKINQHNGKIHIRRGQRTTSLSASDEGIVVDYGDEVTRKRKVSKNLNKNYLCHKKAALVNNPKKK
jgi:hypothetical protein